MAYIIACLMAALSFLANKLLLKYIGPQVIVTWGPVVEEAAKTLLAWQLSADILLTHIVFGLLEGTHDWLTGGQYRLQAALASVAGHALFGYSTVAVLGFTGSVLLAAAGAMVIHGAWNMAIIRLQQ